jgi:outer membrane protein assembly factor BamB
MRPVLRAAMAVAAVAAVVAILAAVLGGGNGQTSDAGPVDSVPPTDTLATEPEASYPSAEEIAANWPCFRGPGGLGKAVGATAPVSWNGETGENILWKVAVPLPGAASPVVWGDRVFIAGADKEARELYCFDAGSGKMLWRAPVDVAAGEARKPIEVWNDLPTIYASSTPATDGRRVCVIFATGDLACFDFSGRELWARNVGVPENAYGHASSLALHENLLLVQLDQAEAEDGSPRSRLMALDVATGETVWETRRPVRSSWATPSVVSADGGEQVVTAADKWVISYDLKTGVEIWRANCLSGDVVASPVHAGGLVFTAMEYSNLSGIRLDGRGDVTDTHVAWSVEGDLPSICTPLHDGNRLYCLSSPGILTCWAPETGQLQWEGDTDASFQASPVLAAGRVYMFGDEGVCVIIKAADKYEEVGKPELGEECAATPAFVGGRIYARGKSSLFCIAEQ